MVADAHASQMRPGIAPSREQSDETSPAATRWRWAPTARGVVATLITAALLLSAIGWGLGALITAVAQSSDADIVGDIASNRDGPLTAMAHALSLVGSVYAVAPLTLMCSLWLYRRRYHVAALALGLSVAGGALIANTDKLLVNRARPVGTGLAHVDSTSFPSGHATQAAALYMALLLTFLAARPRRSIAVVAGAGAAIVIAGVAISRVYLGVHYPSDVAAGVLLGASWAALVCRLLVRPSPPTSQ